MRARGTAPHAPLLVVHFWAETGKWRLASLRSKQHREVGVLARFCARFSCGASSGHTAMMLVERIGGPLRSLGLTITLIVAWFATSRDAAPRNPTQL